MGVTKDIAEYAKTLSGDLTVEDLCVGVGYTCVKLSDGKGGLAYTFRNDLGDSCGVIGRAGSLTGTPVKKILDWADSKNLAEASIGLATANALLNERFSNEENIANAVDCSENDIVGMVGYFCPLVRKYQSAEKLYIFERGLKAETVGDASVLPEEAQPMFLPKCNKIVMTATSFINKTADKLLKMCKNAEEIIIVGASTPMCPEILKPYGVTVLAGTRVTDADSAMRIVSQGGGGMAFSGVSLKLFERI